MINHHWLPFESTPQCCKIPVVKARFADRREENAGSFVVFPEPLAVHGWIRPQPEALPDRKPESLSFPTKVRNVQRSAGIAPNMVLPPSARRPVTAFKRNIRVEKFCEEILVTPSPWTELAPALVLRLVNTAENCPSGPMLVCTRNYWMSLASESEMGRLL